MSRVFFVIAVLGLEVFGVILAGYASASRWSLFGAMREAAQVVGSAEVPLGMCVVVPVMLAGTMDLVTIAEKQSGWFTSWYLFHDPFAFVIFWVYVTCRGRERQSRRRSTWPRPRANSLPAPAPSIPGCGGATLHGRVWLDVSRERLAAVLFLGGWNGPIPVAALTGLSEGTSDTANYFVRLLGMFNLLGKATLGVLIMMWIRWTLPRLRIDQVMTTCLKYCTPIAAVMFAGVMLWQLFLPGGLVPGLRGRRPRCVRGGSKALEARRRARSPAGQPDAEKVVQVGA